MRIKKIFLVFLPLITLILKLLPNGVVPNFANPEVDPWRRTYSYFSLKSIGYTILMLQK